MGIDTKLNILSTRHWILVTENRNILIQIWRNQIKKKTAVNFGHYWLLSLIKLQKIIDTQIT